MGEKLYRPVIKDGDHLVKSKNNEGRVRGVSQNSHNKTTDIIEWEEMEIGTQGKYWEPEKIELTPEQQERVDAIGRALAEVIICGVKQLNDYVIHPWWEQTAKPWIKGKTVDIKPILFSKTKAEQVLEEHKKYNNTVSVDPNIHIDKMLNREFDSIQFDMSSEDAKQHVIKLIYHIFGIAYEIRILCNTRIAEQVEDEELRLENQLKVERLLSEKVANSINELLSNDQLSLDISTSKQLFRLLGGGVRLNGDYVPVELDKVSVAISSMKKNIEK